MDKYNLIFSSNINEDVANEAFDILYSLIEDEDYDEVYVKNVVLAPSEILFFVKIDGNESIIRVPLTID